MSKNKGKIFGGCQETQPVVETQSIKIFTDFGKTCIKKILYIKLKLFSKESD